MPTGFSNRAAPPISAGALVMAAILALAAAGPAWAQGAPERVAPGSQAEIQLSYAPVVKKAAPAVVNIYAEKLVRRRASPMMADPFFERFMRRFRGPGFTRERIERSLGSGVIVDESGLVVTNQHVIAGAVEITVALNDRREFTAEVLLADEGSDLAVLQLDDPAELPFLEFGDSDAMEVGDLVLAIGNPFGVGQTVTTGILSAAARTTSGGQTFLQTDAAINPGNSGGALVDMRGRLVGVNSAILTRSGGSNGIGFAIPATLAAQAVRQARSGAMRLSRPWLGVAAQVVDATIAGSLGLRRPQGVILQEVAPQSPFAAAGLGPGSVVLSVEGEPIDDPGELSFRLNTLGVGATAALEVLDRRGRRQEARIDLIAAPETPPRREREISGRTSLSGLAIANLNPALAEELGRQLGRPARARLSAESGVVVIGARGRAARYGLRAGDLLRVYNGYAIDAVEDLVDVIEAEPGLEELLFDRDGRRLTLRLR
ncbi:MAG: trypsin-like peptidase domain-containing protein [Pseudomonadota bacterium]